MAYSATRSRPAQPRQVEPCSFDQRPHGRRLDLYSLACRARLDPSFSVGFGLDAAAVHDLRHLQQQLDDAATHVERATHEDDGGVRRRVLNERFEALLLGVGRGALRLG